MRPRICGPPRGDTHWGLRKRPGRAVRVPSGGPGLAPLRRQPTREVKGRGPRHQGNAGGPAPLGPPAWGNVGKSQLGPRL